MLGVHLRYNRKTHIDNITSCVEIIIQMKKKKIKKATKPQISVMSVLLGELPDRSPVVKNSGKNLVSDRSVARINDYLKGNQKDDA